MDQEVKALWVKALRSGDYKQGKTQLRWRDKYCCLGVACDLAVKQDVIPPAQYDAEDDFYYYGTDRHISPIDLPLDVQQWMGVRGSDPSVTVNGERPALSHLNDYMGYTFDQIADIIEEQL